MPKLNLAIVQGQATIEVRLTNRELSSALWQVISRLCPIEDDAGCDWVTDGRGQTWIVYSDPQCVSSDPNVAALVDAANYLVLGRIPKGDGNGYAEHDQDALRPGEPS